RSRVAPRARPPRGASQLEVGRHARPAVDPPEDPRRRPDPRRAQPVSTAAGDAALVPRAVAGDREAFAALVAPRVPELSRLCRRLAGPALADDCTQDTLVLALLRLGSLRDADAFGWWLRGIAIRVCHRARARVAPHASLPDDDATLWIPGPESAPPLEERL